MQHKYTTQPSTIFLNNSSCFVLVTYGKFSNVPLKGGFISHFTCLV